MATGDKIVVSARCARPFEFVTEDEFPIGFRIEISGLLQITRNGKFVAAFSPHFWTYVTCVPVEEQ
jgi:hypothetical protein